VPFPLPLNPDFRKEVAYSWLVDVCDRIDLGDYEGAQHSLKTAHDLLMQLPPGEGCPKLDRLYLETSEKLEKIPQT
jgi:hypothetical protein